MQDRFVESCCYTLSPGQRQKVEDEVIQNLWWYHAACWLLAVRHSSTILHGRIVVTLLPWLLASYTVLFRKVLDKHVAANVFVQVAASWLLSAFYDSAVFSDWARVLLLVRSHAILRPNTVAENHSVLQGLWNSV